MSDNPDVPTPQPEPGTTVPNVSFVVTGREAEIRTTMRVIELAAVKDGATIPIVTMSVRAARELRDMLTTEIGFEDQLPPAAPAAG